MNEFLVEDTAAAWRIEPQGWTSGLCPATATRLPTPAGLRSPLRSTPGTSQAVLLHQARIARTDFRTLKEGRVLCRWSRLKRRLLH